jgi:hypothetical protein
MLPFDAFPMTIGANGIYDLGTVDFNSVNNMEDSGYEQLIKAVPGHVYIIKLADSSVAKLKIVRNLKYFSLFNTL